MGLFENIIIGVVSGVSATAVVTLFAMLWRKRVVGKYKLSKRAKLVLASLWDEGLIRPVSAIAKELGIPEEEVEEELENLNKNGLARIRKINENGSPLWKITWKGQEYLSQISWLGDLIT
ncbi:MAG: hypothetical protein KZQ92_11550 [Candidatus Thiodiazotropha sp. (ex Lucinoma borealis)]|nr:hypothetical protein [Candidatus Thiodiazotropha sp. (ex Lucinoma borealis)]MCU7864595.1 hypothetical protein [Candidatus Thiodiazotropha sp. (ex Lucinoma borealis)]MCU7867298.1 hypothetical protein [Candidatus Thiodiazotropha sp. (ex Lucinoma borealis)]